MVSGEEIVLGNLRIIPNAYRAMVDGQSLALTSQEFALLTTLAVDAGRIITREAIARKLWNSADPDEQRRLAVLIFRLRQELRGSFPCRIETVRKRGYGLIAVVGAARRDIPT